LKKINFELNKVFVIVPACITIGSNNNYLNLNVFSNWHYLKRNKIKKLFTSRIKSQMLKIPVMSKIHSLTYTLIRTTNTKRDRMNVYAIIDKFFCDALQEYGKIKDDSDEYIGDFNFTKTEYIKGKANELRVRIEIYFEK
tara:strand:+ start:141 stop:560 length:420 start_codon:yes stop_codon:yes gene_type:complete